MTSYNLVRCLRCRRTFIREEYEEHLCTPDHKGVRRIPIDMWSESKTDSGEPMIMAFGLDGFVYRLEQVKENLGFEELSDETLQDENRRNPTESGQNPGLELFLYIT
jgi:hypothetical protein